MSILWNRVVPVMAAAALLLGISTVSARAADAPEKKEGKGSVTGTVKDKDGKALEGIEVRLMKPRQRPPGGGGGGGGQPPAPQATQGQGAIELQQSRPAPVATATTDKDGKYTMKDIEVGDYAVVVRDDAKKQYGRARVTIEADKEAVADIACSDVMPQRPGGGGGGGNQGGGGGGNR